MKSRLVQRWEGPGGCAEVLRLAVPLILSTSAHTLQMFVDRMFLMWYSPDAMPAAMQSSVLGWTFMSLFVGTASYVNTFVAQYSGARRPRRVGASVWQGMYFGVAAGLAMLVLIPFAETIFNWVGHAPAVRQYEITYFKLMRLAGPSMLIATALSGFFTGRGRTRTVMYVTMGVTALNIVLDYCLIFGKFGLPQWGIGGAAIATVAASYVGAGVYLCLFLRAKYRRKYATLSGWRFDGELFLRMMRYGLPNGVQWMLDMMAFALFITLVGRISSVSLSATAVAFQINMLAFMPVIGLGIAISTLVGQSLGEDQPELAQRSTWSACYLAIGYLAVLAAGFILLPDVFIYPFAVQAQAAEFAPIRPIVEKLLCYVAIYCIFDACIIVFAGALKGAGDTRFVMLMSVGLHWVLLAAPSLIAVKMGWGLYVYWSFLTGFVFILAVAFFLRFMSGKWKSMRVIEAVTHGVPPELPDVSSGQVEGT